MSVRVIVGFLFFVISINVNASVFPSASVDIVENFINKPLEEPKEPLHLFGVSYIQVSIQPNNEGCVVFDLTGKLLRFPNYENERLLSQGKVAFSPQCLNSDINPSLKTNK